MRLLLLTVVASLIAANASAAPLCWRGKPLPECGTFVITELGVYARIDDDPTGGGGTPLYFTLDLGLMKNDSPTSAIGVTGFGGTGDEHARVGLRGRYRRWLSRNTSVDVAPGVIVYGSEDGGYNYQAPGAILGVTLNYRDWVALAVEVEHDRFERGFSYPGDSSPETISDTTWRAGGKLGSGFGVVGTAALVAGFIYLITAIGE